MAFVRDRMGAEHIEQPFVAALVHQVVVDRSQHRSETIGIGDQPFRPAVACTVGDGLRFFQLDRTFEQAVADKRQHAQRLAFLVKGFGRFRAGQDGPGDPLPVLVVYSQPSKGIAVRSGYERIQFAAVWCQIIPQISAAYSRMVRSDENQPILAVL